MIGADAIKAEKYLTKWRADPEMTGVLFSGADRARFRTLGAKPVWDRWVRDNETVIPTAGERIDRVVETAKGG